MVFFFLGQEIGKEEGEREHFSSYDSTSIYDLYMFIIGITCKLVGFGRLWCGVLVFLGFFFCFLDFWIFGFRHCCFRSSIFLFFFSRYRCKKSL